MGQLDGSSTSVSRRRKAPANHQPVDDTMPLPASRKRKDTRGEGDDNLSAMEDALDIRPKKRVAKSKRHTSNPKAVKKESLDVAIGTLSASE